MSLRTETQKPATYEPISPKKDCKVQIQGAEMGTPWKHKEGTPEGETKVMKVQLLITDEDVQTENVDSKPTRRIDDLVILEKHPYVDKATGEVKWMAMNKLYQLQEALGFTPTYVDGEGNEVEAYTSRTGRKSCPKGASIKLNEGFLDTYFDSSDEPRFDAWMAIDVVASVGYKRQSADDDEQYGRKNEVKSYRPKQD